MLFINKSVSDTCLSHSVAQEGLDIRRYIQRRNRRAERASRKMSASNNRDDNLLQRKPREYAGSSSHMTVRADVTFNSAYQRPDPLKERKCTECSWHPKRWILYSSDQDLPKPSPKLQTNMGGLAQRSSKDTRMLCRQILCRTPPERASWSSAERRGSDYFMKMIASRFTSSECLAFWDILLPCLLEEDFGVRLLVTSLALTHESCDLSQKDPWRTRDCYEGALRYCNKAMKHIREHAEYMPKATVGVTCILVASIEMLRGNVVSVEACLDSGIAMAGGSRAEMVERRWRRPVTSKASTSSSHAVEVTLAKMSGAFHVFGLGAERQKIKRKFRPTISSMNMQISFADLEGVNTLAEMLYSATLRAIEDVTDNVESGWTSAAASALLQGFENFHQGLKSVRVCGSTSMSALEIFQRTQIQEVKVLEAQIAFNCIVLDNDEMSFDNWTTAFEKILRGIQCKLEQNTSDSSRLTCHPFSAVFVTPLWLTASRCRVPHLRRSAIYLLGKFRRRETTYDSVVAANIAQNILTLEESFETKNMTCRGIQCPSRVRLVAAEYLATCRCVQLEYVLSTADDIQPRRIIHERLPCNITSEWWVDNKATSCNALLQSLLIYSRDGKFRGKMAVCSS